MRDKHSIEAFFRINGISTDMPEDAIAQECARLGWSQGEIDEALSVLRGTPQNAPAPAPDPARAFFTTGLVASSAQVSSLLGVDVHLDPSLVRDSEATQKKLKSDRLYAVFGGCAIVILSLAVAVGAGAGAAYVLQIGPFRM